MKKNLIQLYIFATVLLTDFRMFAQEEGEPGDDSDTGNLENEDAAPLPINGKLIYLAIAGALFAYYMYRKNKQTETK